MVSIVLYILVIIGLAFYFVKPRYFFFYWLSIQPYILPVFFILFESNFTPVSDKFLPLYFGFPEKLSTLMVFLFVLSFLRSGKELKIFSFISVSLFLLFSFLLIQNILVGFSLNALYANVKSILWSLAPMALLIVDERLRPSRESLFHFISVFVFVQSFFCLLNFSGISIYGDVTGGFDEHLICGTFTRYNHMANYLAVFFFVLTYECFGRRGIDRKKYFLLSSIIGLLIALSGSRMTLLLFGFTAYFFFCLFQSKKVVVATFLISAYLFSSLIIGNNNFYGEVADEGTGLERNMIGVIDLANSDDLSEGSTLSMSAYILMTKFDSPIMGNGRSYREGHFYGHPSDTYNNENIFKTDARLAFMLIEYGVIGLGLLLLMFANIFKGCFLFSEEKNKALYWGAGFYFLLFSITDNGFWDYTIFSVVLIYVFSNRRVAAELPSKLVEVA